MVVMITDFNKLAIRLGVFTYPVWVASYNICPNCAVRGSDYDKTCALCDTALIKIGIDLEPLNED